jgi:hypothetical protein
LRVIPGTRLVFIDSPSTLPARELSSGEPQPGTLSSMLITSPSRLWLLDGGHQSERNSQTEPSDQGAAAPLARRRRPPGICTPQQRSPHR